MAAESPLSSESPERLPFRFVISRVILILFGILLAFTCLEITMHIIPVPSYFTLTKGLEELWEPDPELLLRLKPSQDSHIVGHPEFSFTVQTNDDGLRDEPFEGAFDIAAIGNSFTFGFGVEMEESWPNRLEAISGKRVANLGWAGWNSHIYPIAIRRYAIPLQTNLWIWTFFGNDLPESAGAESFISSGETNYIEWAPQGAAAKKELSFPWSLRTFQLLVRLIKPELFLLPNSGDGVYDDGELKMRYGLYAWETTDPAKQDVVRGWELTKDALLEALDLSAEHDASLVVVYIPNREHVYWSYLKSVMTDVGVAQLDSVERQLQDFCMEHGIYYVNLLPPFQEKAVDGEMLYFPADGHWNAAGHDFAATIISDYLNSVELLSTE